MFSDELKKLEERHLRRSLVTIQSPPSPEVVVNGKKCLLFCSNNYLGLAEEPRAIAAACEVAKEFGWGAGASRLLSGNHSLHEKLEAELANFTGLEATRVFGSGYQANTGALPVLAGAEDLILSDELNHASLIDGCRLSRAQIRVYHHRDLNHLEEILKKEGGQFRRRLIVTESVFSMEGTLCPVDGVWNLAKKYDALLYVDEAHAVGVLGEKGEGAVRHFKINPNENLIQMGTLGKSLGAFGAFVAGSEDFSNLLINQARTFIFATAFPPANAAFVLAILKILRDEKTHLENLRHNCRLFADGLKKIGIEVEPEQSFLPIQPVFIGDEVKALRLAERLEEAGILARAIRPPTVPKERSRIRFSLMATHLPHQIDHVLTTLTKIL